MAAKGILARLLLRIKKAAAGTLRPFENAFALAVG